MRPIAKQYFFRDGYVLCDLIEGLESLNQKASKAVSKDIEEVIHRVKPNVSDELLSYHSSVKLR